MRRITCASVLATVATVAAGLALVRLADAVGKRELIRTNQELIEKLTAVDHQFQALADQRKRLQLDEKLLSHRIAVMSKREPYLVINRDRGIVQLGLEDKILLETRFRMGGPEDDVEAFLTMPKATLEVLGKQSPTSWFRPDWLYNLEGVTPPADSAARTVPDAFGPGAIFLGGGIVIHGKVREEVPAEAIDYKYIELKNEALKSILGVLRPGSLVFIQ